MRPGRERRKQLVGFAGHVHRNRPIRFGEGTVVEQKGAIYETKRLLEVAERPGEPGIDLSIGNVVPASGNPFGDSRQGCFHVVQSDKNQQDDIPLAWASLKNVLLLPAASEKTVSMQKDVDSNRILYSILVLLEFHLSVFTSSLIYRGDVIRCALGSTC
jgi:hypothetical protein